MGGDPNAKVYTLNEVSKHNKENDCWVIINGKVYDVSSYLEEHPGGDEVLLSATGKDATDDFEDAGHSASARETMEEYYIGEIDPSTVSMKSTSEQTHYNPDKTFEIMMKILQFAAPVVFLGLVAAFRFYTKKK